MSHPFRNPDHDIEPLFHLRWSRRAYSEEAITDADLFRAFEAARWAPSGGNSQPWRFLYARRGGAHWDGFLDVLMERNRLWAANASVLIAILSRKSREREGKVILNRSHSFDTGAAWSNFAHQAHALGLNTRAIGGFDNAKARDALSVPADFEIEAFVALGRPAAPEALPDDFRDLEKPTSRRAISELVLEGPFAFHAGQ